MLKAIFYLLGIVFILIRLNWLWGMEERKEMLAPYKGMKFTGKLKNMPPEVQKSYRWGMFFVLSYIWLIIGLFSFNWLLFLCYLIIGMVILNPLAKLFKNNSDAETIIGGISFVLFLITVFVSIINTYHVKFDFTRYVQGFIN